MPSPAKRGGKSGEVALLGIFVAYALVISLIERTIPLSFSIPGIRLGLANVVVLMAMYLFPLPRAFLLMVVKCLMAAMFAGSPTALFYALGGSLLSFAVMAALILLLREHISPVGVSVAGAAFHNIGQVLVACLVLKSWVVLLYLPALLLIGIVTGALIGILVLRVRPSLEAFLGMGRGA